MHTVYRTFSDLQAVPLEAWLSIAEAARLGRTSRQRISLAVRKEWIPATRVGPFWLIRKRDLETFLRVPPPIGRPKKYTETREKIYA